MSSPISGSDSSTQTSPEYRNLELTDQKKPKKTLSKEEEKKLIAWADYQYKCMKEDRARIELQWALNLAFFFGKQNVQVFGSGNTRIVNSTRLIVPRVPPWKTRLIINRIRPAVRTEISKLTSQKPSVTVTPASTEDRDIFAAQAAEEIWESEYRNKRFKSVLRKAVWWTCITGCGYIKTYWDYNKTYQGVKQTKNEDGTSSMLMDEQDGDICFVPITPYHILVPNLREEEIEDQPFIMEVQARSIDWVKACYPQLGNIDTDTAAASDILSDQVIDLLTGTGSYKNDCVLVKECWIKPGQLPSVMPSGGVITIVGNKIAQYVEGWPFEHGFYPVAKLDHIPSGKYYSDSTITDLIPLQKELNRTRSQIIENKNRMAKMQLLAAKGSIDPKKITSEPGLVIQYTPGFDPPQPMPLTPLPAYVTQEIDRILQDINDISGQHEVTKGQAPPGVTAATAISYLQEQDESMLSHTYDSLEEAVEKTAFMCLSLVRQYWTLPRMVQITGPDGIFDVQSFKGSDLTSTSDVKVEGGSSLPTSKAARMALIMDMMKMGFIPPDQGLEVLEMGGLTKITDRIKVDNRQAQRENLKMAAVTEQQIDLHSAIQMQKAQAVVDPQTGQATPTNPDFLDPNTGQPIDPPIMIPVNTWDNHAVHIQVHNNYRKSQAFENLSDINKQLFEAHVSDHLMALQVEMFNNPIGAKPTGQEDSNGGQSTNEGVPPPMSEELPAESSPMG